MRFRCKFRQQMVLGAQSQTDEANGRQRYNDKSSREPLQSGVAPLCEPDAKLSTKRKRIDGVDTPSPPRRIRTGSTSQPEMESRRRATTPTNGVENSAVDASAFQRVQLPPTGCLPSSPTSGQSLMTSSTPATSGMNLAADGAGLFLFPRLVASPRALPVGIQAPDRIPPGFPSAIAPSPNELHPVNGLNNNNNNNDSKMAAAGGCGAADLTPKMAMVQPDPRLQSLPFVCRSPNPVIDKMLNLFGSAAAVAAAAAAATGGGAVGVGGGPMAPSFPSLNLVQNWCAKCNTSFRMTSDLVYHMRSHHKREFDPVKRRKDDKLRCEVCGESFRERHHLTRHMTSHS